MTNFLDKQSYELEEFDEKLVRRLIEKVTMHDDKIEVEFKSGISIDIEKKMLLGSNTLLKCRGFSYLFR